MTFKLESIREPWSPENRSAFVTLRFRVMLTGAVDNGTLQAELQDRLSYYDDGRYLFEVEALAAALHRLLVRVASPRPRRERDWRCPKCGTIWTAQGPKSSRLEKTEEGTFWVTEERPPICRPCTDEAHAAWRAQREELMGIACCRIGDFSKPEIEQADRDLERMREEELRDDHLLVFAEPISDLRVFDPPKLDLHLTEVGVGEGDQCIYAKAEVKIEDAPNVEDD